MHWNFVGRHRRLLLTKLLFAVIAVAPTSIALATTPTSLILDPATGPPISDVASDPSLVEWVRQAGRGNDDSGTDVAIDDQENAYLTGAVGNSAFVTKVNAAGDEVWSREIAEFSAGVKINVDSDGNLLVAGGDGLLIKYSPQGDEIWTRHYGTDEYQSYESAYDVVIDQQGNSYITGATSGTFPGGQFEEFYDSFVAKLNSEGEVLWFRQSGVAQNYDEGRGVGVDGSGNVYVAGNLSFGGPEGFLQKLDATGAPTWDLDLRLFHGYDDGEVRGLSVDEAGNSYVAVSRPTTASVLLFKFDTDSNLVWERDFAATSFPNPNNPFNEPWDIELDENGNVIITGYTTSDFAKDQSGVGDALLLQYSGDGELLLAEQLGAFNSYDYGLGIGVGPNRSVFVSGFTQGGFGSESAGSLDAFLVKLRLPVPEPSTALLLLGGMALTLSVRCSHRLFSK